MKIDEVASNHEGVAAEEALILRGWVTESRFPTYQLIILFLKPTSRPARSLPGCPGAFERQYCIQGCRQRLYGYGKRSDHVFLTSPNSLSFLQARLVETGAKKLTQLYTKLVAEGSSGTAPAPGSDVVQAPSPDSLIASLSSLVVFLRTLPVPSTHPSHPTAPAILSVLKEAQRGYADMRGNWAKKCLEAQGKRVLDRADNIDPGQAGRDFGSWVRSLLSVAQARHPHICIPTT